MKNTYKILKLLSVSLFIFYLSCATTNPKPTLSTPNVTIYRDNWGVPHIFGQKDSDVAFGLAYAHAEDDFGTIENVLLATRGKLSTKIGKKGAPNDYLVNLLRISRQAEENYYDLSLETIELLEGYAAGFNYYLNKYPKMNRNKLYPVNGKDIFSGFLYRTPLMFEFNWFITELLKDKKPDFAQNHTKTSDYVMHGSNVIGINPNRTDDGSTRIAINAHQPWEGPVTWYEAHLHSEDGLDINGGLFPGSPVILIGHNRYLGWSHTVNDPDLVDVYELSINPDNEYQYQLDGKWMDFERDIAKIKIKLFGPFTWTVKREVLWSKHGPVVKASHGTYALRYSSIGKTGQVEQWYKMNKAKNLTEFKEAMKMMQIPMFNTGYADFEGNLFYIYNALLPRRLDGYDWKGILPGDNSDLIWDSYHSFDSLPQLTNPKSGFIQNCNSTPYLISSHEDNPIKILSDNTGIETFQTNRALRAHETFGKDESISKEEFYKYKYDTYYSKKSAMNNQINRFLDEVESDDIIIHKALEIIKNWDLGNQEYNRGAAIVMLTFKPSFNSEEDTYNYNDIINRLHSACDFLMNTFGRLDIELGKLQRIKRGNVNLPVGGGPDVLRAIYSKMNNNQLIAWNGDCYFEMVEWDKNGNVSAESIHQYGSATLDSTSIHYSDQSLLFYKYKMKPVLMEIEDIKNNLERYYTP